MAKVRLFTAVRPPETAVGSLGPVLSEAGRRYGGVRWVLPARLHLTLRFFGDQDESRVPGIVGLLGQAAGSTGGFEAELGGAGAFPDLSHPRVLFVPAVRGQECFRELAEAISGAMREIGIGAGEGEYHAHLTLGRVKERADGRPALGFLKENIPPSLGAFPVDRFILFQSRLASEGPVYCRLEEFPLNRHG